jgi:hypothetical protein
MADNQAAVMERRVQSPLDRTIEDGFRRMQAMGLVDPHKSGTAEDEAAALALGLRIIAPNGAERFVMDPANPQEWCAIPRERLLVDGFLRYDDPSLRLTGFTAAEKPIARLWPRPKPARSGVAATRQFEEEDWEDWRQIHLSARIQGTPDSTSAGLNPVSAAAPALPTKSAVAVSVLDPGCDEQYRNLARSLGICDPAAVNAELEAFLAEQFMEVYPLESVQKYMHALCHAQSNWDREFGRAQWDWLPLRKQDADGYVSVLTKNRGRLYNSDGKKPVPYPVLETVAAIAERFGDQVRFCVTDVDLIPDPFLGVGARTAQGVFRMHVVERWDEPKYRP